MKKTYSTPEIKVALIECESSITAASYGIKGEYDGNLQLKARQRGNFDFDEEFEADFE